MSRTGDDTEQRSRVSADRPRKHEGQDEAPQAQCEQSMGKQCHDGNHAYAGGEVCTSVEKMYELTMSCIGIISLQNLGSAISSLDFAERLLDAIP